MASLTAQQRQDLIEELPRLKRFCLSLTSDPSDADDLLQITVERLLEKGMPHDAHVAKWSHRVCRNLWIDEIRSRDVRNRYAQSESAVEGAGTTSANSDDSVQLDRVSAAMDRLPTEQRAALVPGCRGGLLLRRSGSAAGGPDRHHHESGREGEKSVGRRFGVECGKRGLSLRHDNRPTWEGPMRTG
ncbi:MAG: hypothetical protein CM15mP74_36510 [Halieaceae bacterium]|nr:MAG: hypothetical protein CM15mP74_36510 [Halieaceae bacterium]